MSALPDIPESVRERWLLEIERCETRQLMALTWDCHQLEMQIILQFRAWGLA